MINEGIQSLKEEINELIMRGIEIDMRVIQRKPGKYKGNTK